MLSLMHETWYGACPCLLGVIRHIHLVAEWSTTDIPNDISNIPSAVVSCGSFLPPEVANSFLPAWEGDSACTGPGLGVHS